MTTFSWWCRRTSVIIYTKVTQLILSPSGICLAMAIFPVSSSDVGSNFGVSSDPARLMPHTFLTTAMNWVNKLWTQNNYTGHVLNGLLYVCEKRLSRWMSCKVCRWPTLSSSNACRIAPRHYWELWLAWLILATRVYAMGWVLASPSGLQPSSGELQP
jgi:hypothetical protein